MSLTKQKALEAFERRPGVPLRLSKVMKALGVDKSEQRGLRRLLKQLRAEGRLVLLGGNQYALSSTATT